MMTKLTKPSVCVNLVGPQVSLPLWWVPTSRGYSFLCVIRRHFLVAAVGPAVSLSKYISLPMEVVC